MNYYNYSKIKFIKTRLNGNLTGLFLEWWNARTGMQQL